jgi:hypothetical protein
MTAATSSFWNDMLLLTLSLKQDGWPQKIHRRVEQDNATEINDDALYCVALL